MARTPQDVTDTELAVLQVLWERGPSSRRQIADVLYPDGGPAHFTTVQKLLERLEKKGCVARDAGEGPITFTATLNREQLISRRLLDVADKLCGGSLTPLLMNLVRLKQAERRLARLQRPAEKPDGEGRAQQDKHLQELEQKVESLSPRLRKRFKYARMPTISSLFKSC